MKYEYPDSKIIHDFLKNTVISGDAMFAWINGDGKKMAQQLRPFCNYLHTHAPQKLYRMRRFDEKSIDALKNDQLYYTRADWFNDPYDCLLCFDPKRLRKEINQLFSDEYLAKAFEKIGTLVPDLLLEDKDNYIRAFSTIREEVIDRMCEKSNDVVSALQKSAYVVCFTETVDSPIMWSHYSDNHKGYAIEYEFEATSFPPAPHISDSKKNFFYGWNSLLPVAYSDIRADATDLAKHICICESKDRLSPKDLRWDEAFFLPDMLLRTKLSLTKSKVWSYEKEWRMIMTFEWPNDMGQASIHKVKKATAIYLGERMEKSHKEELIKIAEKKGIPVFEMYIDYSSTEYRMHYRKL